MPLIPAPMLKAVCHIGEGAQCCRYIVGAGGGLQCAKHDWELAIEIDHRVADGAFTARGDNCEGLRNE